MAKIGFTKLGLKSNNEIKTIEFNGQDIEVKQYLPVEEKLELINNILKLSHDSNNFSNSIKVKVYTILGIIENYTNINFTEKQKENPTKLYDLITSNKLDSAIIEVIPKKEYENLIVDIYNIIEAVYKYRNSIMGILENIAQDYNDLNLDIDEIQKKITETNGLETLQEIMSKLG